MTSETERVFRIAVLVLLAAMLFVQARILNNLDSLPTIERLRSASTQRRQQLLRGTPLVRVTGEVDVSNTPLEVQITDP